jgi:hypothetical protein
MTPETTFRYDVFISYSHQDTDWVWQQLLPRLERAGLRVCIDRRDFEIGTPSLVNMERAVDNSRHTLLVLTPAWVESEWTDFESLLGGTGDPAGRRRKLFPLMLKDCEPPRRISGLTWAEFGQPDEHVDQFERLLKQLRESVEPARPLAEDASPFIAGPPIMHPRGFFGREREIRRIFGLLKQPPLQNAAIIGPRRSGKTSLLQYLKNITVTPPTQLRPGQRRDWLPRPERYRWVFVDFQDPRVGTREGLLHHLLTSLGLVVPVPCDLERFLDVMCRNLNLPTVILLDEIGMALQRYPGLDDAFWEGLRSLAGCQAGGNLAFILASHTSPIELAHDSGHSSPFFNIFGYTTTLGPLTETEACALIASSPIPFPAEDFAWILERSGHWPLLLQLLCRERLVTLEDGETGAGWQTEGLRQIVTFRHLLEAT